MLLLLLVVVVVDEVLVVPAVYVDLVQRTVCCLLTCQVLGDMFGVVGRDMLKRHVCGSENEGFGVGHMHSPPQGLVSNLGPHDQGSSRVAYFRMVNDFGSLPVSTRPVLRRSISEQHIGSGFTSKKGGL